jgi:hypothetical protein
LDDERCSGVNRRLLSAAYGRNQKVQVTFESRLRFFLAQRLGPSLTTGTTVERNSSQAHSWALFFGFSRNSDAQHFSPESP